MQQSHPTSRPGTQRPLITDVIALTGWLISIGSMPTAGGQAESAPWSGAVVRSTELLPKNEDHGERAFGFAAAMTRNGCQTAKVEGTAAAQWVRLNGISGSHYQAVAALQFSANGKTLAYVAATEKNQLVVIGGTAGPAFHQIEPTTLVLSADGRRHAYAVRQAAGLRMVIDGKLYESRYDCWAAPAVFSPDGRRVAFLEVDPTLRLMRVVVDEKPRPACGGIGVDSLAFSADSRHFSYSANIGTAWHRVIDDVVQPAFERLGLNFAFSPDGGRHAYTAWADGGHVLVQNGKVRPIPGSVDRGLVFSPDGRQFAIAMANSESGVWVERNGEKGAEFDGLGGAPPYEAKGDSFSSYWPLRSGLYHGAASAGIVFSPNSKRLAYPVRSGRTFRMMVDGKVHGPYDALSGGFLFSPDSARFAFAGQRGAEHYLVVDGRPCGPYDRIGHFEFSPNSRHVACHAVKDGTSVVLVNGVERARYAGVPAGPAFRHDGALELISVQGTGLQQVVVNKF